jgi:anti-anti-sigma factor
MDELSDERPAGFELLAGDQVERRVALSGELDFATVPAVEEALAGVLAERPRRLVLDLSAVSFADSSAIALWVRCSSEVEHFELHGVSPLLARVLERMGLLEKLGVQRAGASDE